MKESTAKIGDGRKKEEGHDKTVSECFRASGRKSKSETQVKSRDIRDLFKRGGNEYTQQKRIEKRKNMEVINID